MSNLASSSSSSSSSSSAVVDLEQRFPLRTAADEVPSQHHDRLHLTDSQRNREVHYVSCGYNLFSDSGGLVPQ